MQYTRVNIQPNGQRQVSIALEGGGGGVNSDLEVVVAGQGDEEVQQKTLAVFKHLYPVVVQT